MSVVTNLEPLFGNLYQVIFWLRDEEMEQGFCFVLEDMNEEPVNGFNTLSDASTRAKQLIDPMFNHAVVIFDHTNSTADNPKLIVVKEFVWVAKDSQFLQ